MNSFLQNILKKSDGEPVFSDSNNGISVAFKLTNPSVTLNNSCETVFEGSINVPLGLTGVLSGVLIRGIQGSGNPGNNGVESFLGEKNLSEGQHDYTVDLGNSNIENLGSLYILSITLSDNRSKNISIQRTSFHSAFYDKSPC